ncbi:MAG TPA: ornithine cyclodeaminase family protein [Candidatus Acidoferrales bacterium]|nr:ornithine cyclodeaminase family protein [Candidatus Acidoferrales bacterium]
MRVLELPEIDRLLDYPEVIERMRDALIAYASGECDTPMPMHLEIAPEQAEVHMKSSYRRGGKYFALKIAATFPRNLERGLPVGNGMMLLSSAETGAPVAFLRDAGHLTDVRTAAVAALAARELGRRDKTIGIIGTGIQARLQVELHAQVLPLERVVLWGRNPERVEACRREIARFADVSIAAIPAEVAHETRLIVTCTAARAPLLHNAAVHPGTHLSCVGSDSPGKQEIDAAILRRATLVLADSRRQCEKLGELQHAPDVMQRAVELGDFFAAPRAVEPHSLTVCDFTGLGVEDLCIAESCWEKVA